MVFVVWKMERKDSTGAEPRVPRVASVPRYVSMKRKATEELALPGGWKSRMTQKCERNDTEVEFFPSSGTLRITCPKLSLDEHSWQEKFNEIVPVEVYNTFGLLDCNETAAVFTFQEPFLGWYLGMSSMPYVFWTYLS